MTVLGCPGPTHGPKPSRQAFRPDIAYPPPGPRYDSKLQEEPEPATPSAVRASHAGTDDGWSGAPRTRATRTMTTHGTKSAYNRGCRCDACREASRLARSRQRQTARDRTKDADPQAPRVSSKEQAASSKSQGVVTATPEKPDVARAKQVSKAEGTETARNVENAKTSPVDRPDTTDKARELMASKASGASADTGEAFVPPPHQWARTDHGWKVVDAENQKPEGSKRPAVTARPAETPVESRPAQAAVPLKPPETVASPRLQEITPGAARAEQPKAEPAKAEQPKAERPKAEPAKAEQPKAEPAKAEQPKAEPAKAEQPKAEPAKAEQPKAEQPKAEPAKAEQPKAEQPKAEQPKAEPARFGLLESAVASSADVWQEISERLARAQKTPAKPAPISVDVTAAVTQSLSEAQSAFTSGLGRTKPPPDANLNFPRAEPTGRTPGDLQVSETTPMPQSATSSAIVDKPVPAQTQPAAPTPASTQTQRDLIDDTVSFPQPSGHEGLRSLLGGLSRRVSGSRSRSNQGSSASAPPPADLLPPPPSAIAPASSSKNQPPPPRADLPPPPGPLPPPPGSLPPPPKKATSDEASGTSGAEQPGP
jgi:hypothetical protein